MPEYAGLDQNSERDLESDRGMKMAPGPPPRARAGTIAVKKTKKKLDDSDDDESRNTGQFPALNQI